jgi:hypothetical protein
MPPGNAVYNAALVQHALSTALITKSRILKQAHVRTSVCKYEASLSAQQIDPQRPSFFAA